MRGRQVLIVAAGLTCIALLREREARDAARRATRTTIAMTVDAVAAWKADHDGACPSSFGDLVVSGQLAAVPRDAWGRALRMACPARLDPHGFDVSSDGPDGIPGGLDRVK